MDAEVPVFLPAAANNFRHYLLNLQNGLDPNGPEMALANVLVNADPNTHGAILENWIRDNLPKLPPSRQRRQQSNRTRTNYGHYFHGTHHKAAEYKKAQDLFRKNKTALAELVLYGKPLLNDNTYPPLNVVEDHFTGILSSQPKTSIQPYNLTEESRPVQSYKRGRSH